MKKYSEFIKKERKQRGWTQQILANKLDVSTATISKYERGEGDIPFSVFEEILEIFDYTSNFLISEKIEEPLQVSFRATTDDAEEEALISWAKNFVKDHYEVIKFYDEKYPVKTH